MLADWETERNRRAALTEMAIALGLSVDQLDDAENQERVIQFVAARASSELFRNRLSDLCGLIQTGWNWLGMLLQVGVILGVIWYTISDDLSDAIHAWWIVAIAVFFGIMSTMFSLLCKLLTGRFPGQSRQSRKMLAELLENRHANGA